MLLRSILTIHSSILNNLDSAVVIAKHTYNICRCSLKQGLVLSNTSTLFYAFLRNYKLTISCVLNVHSSRFSLAYLHTKIIYITFPTPNTTRSIPKSCRFACQAQPIFQLKLSRLAHQKLCPVAASSSPSPPFTDKVVFLIPWCVSLRKCFP